MGNPLLDLDYDVTGISDLYSRCSEHKNPALLYHRLQKLLANTIFISIEKIHTSNSAPVLFPKIELTPSLEEGRERETHLVGDRVCMCTIYSLRFDVFIQCIISS